MSNKFGFLLIDMQERFRSVVSAEMIRQLNTTMHLCREKQIPVIVTQHGHKNLSLDGGVLNEWWDGDLSIVGDESWQLLPELDLDKSKDHFIDQKRRYDAFHGTDLQDFLRQKNVDTVVISGVMTNLCCETTARSAFVRDFRVVFLSDGTATSSQQMHEATLLNIGFGFGKVMKCADFRKIVEKSKAK